MQAADLQVIRDIPGYKAILKTVLRTQIQQLVEQLADQTGEESVLLTASISDGTLSHLGSESGKVFLEDHDDIKSQFLGFCLKRHDKQKQTEKENQQNDIPDHSGTRRSHGKRPRKSPTHVHTSPYLKKTDPPSSSLSHSTMPSSPTQSIQSPTINDHDSDSDSSNIINEPTEEKYNDTIASAGLAKNSVLSNITEIQNKTSKMDTSESKTSRSETETSEVDPNVNVKIEAITESALDPETNVEPGQMAQRDNSLMPNVKQRMGNGPSTSASAQGDMSADSNQGYKIEESLGISAIEENIHVKHLCECGYYTADRSNYNKHKKRCKWHAKTWQSDDGLSTGALSKSRESDERQKYMCDFCGKTFLSKYGMKLHVKTKHEKNFKHTCSICNKTFNQTIQFRYHYSKHLQVPIEKCELCKRAFTSHGSLNRHMKICKNNPTSYEKFRCEVCNMTFSHIHRLRDHQQGKHLPPRYTCNICNKNFSWRSSLKVHKKICR